MEAIAVLPSSGVIDVTTSVRFPARRHPLVFRVRPAPIFTVAPSPRSAVPVVETRRPNIIRARRDTIWFFYERRRWPVAHACIVVRCIATAKSDRSC
jgi:hypothetical protein